ncbi:hypothetical protein [Dactylosporangium salmoneum]|uniref:hypothetical protein n=1 Tax=Dactylosporangium salmoneum TaxID=53361 RepID=UPI003CD09737
MVWDVTSAASAKRLTTLREPSGAVSSVAFGSGGGLLVSGGEGPFLGLWQIPASG